jgi:hypothetical protein
LETGIDWQISASSIMWGKNLFNIWHFQPCFFARENCCRI